MKPAALLVAVLLIGLTPRAAFAAPPWFRLGDRGTKIVRLQRVQVPSGVALPGALAGVPVVRLCYQYTYYAVAGFTFWARDGRFCALGEGRAVDPLTGYWISDADVSRLLNNPNRLPVPFEYRFPSGLLLLAFILVFGVPLAFLRLYSHRSSAGPGVTASVKPAPHFATLVMTDHHIMIRAAFDDAGVPYLVEWIRPNRRRTLAGFAESIAFGEYRFVPAGAPDPRALVVLLEKHSVFTDPPEAHAELRSLLEKMRAV